jgi:uncharacterized membrane protein YgcG
MKTKILSLLLLVATLMFAATGCDYQPPQHHTKQTAQTVKVYKQHKHHNGTNNVVVNNTTVNNITVNQSNDDWLFWYVMFYNNQYYYYSSPTYIAPSGYSGMTWQSSPTSPIAEQPTVNASVVDEAPIAVEQNTVPNAELGTQMEQTIDTTEQQISDMISEGNPNSQDSTPSSDKGGSTDAGGGSSDSGGGSSGGDSGGGGGDGGGGGGD